MPPEAWTILKLLKWTTAYFKSHKIEQPRVDAEVLLAHALGMTRLDLYVLYERPLENRELEVFKALIRRRVRREPVAYIVGEKEFWSMALKVTPDVLIPRPETETLVEATLEIIPADAASKRWRILDLGTGSGAVVLAVASERPGHDFYAVDRSEAALAVAQANARRHGFDKEITWIKGDWFHVESGAPMGCFDIIVSNPPYIVSNRLERLLPEIRDYEPREALDGGEDGLAAIRRIVKEGPEHLVRGGWLLLEIGYDQWREVETLIRDSGKYAARHVVKDYSGFDRVVCANAIKNVLQRT